MSLLRFLLRLYLNGIHEDTEDITLFFRDHEAARLYTAAINSVTETLAQRERDDSVDDRETAPREVAP